MKLIEGHASSKKAKQKAVVKKSFSFGWVKGWNKVAIAASTQIKYASLKLFRRGWVIVLKDLNVSKYSELFQRHVHVLPPVIEEEEEDKEEPQSCLLQPVMCAIPESKRNHDCVHVANWLFLLLADIPYLSNSHPHRNSRLPTDHLISHAPRR